jgi:uncharacterized protein (TIGR02996 family)
MNTQEAILEAIHHNPGDDTNWLVLSDWLEEQGEPERAELTRLRLSLRQTSEGFQRGEMERRVRDLLGGGVRPCVPTRTVSAGLTLALIRPGRFVMGSPEREKGRWDDEGPQHAVTITRGFYLGIHSVTRAQWEVLREDSPGRFREPDHPVTNVSWFQAQEFCRRLSEQTGRSCRLPTEAEWEYACRAGSTSPCYSGEGKKALARVGWCGCAGARQVGRKAPNAWGLYDMLGNVLEWCEDWFDDDYYRISPAVDPRGPAEGDRKVERGGCYGHLLRHCRSAFRRGSVPEHLHEGTGFRVLMEAHGEERS